MLLIGVLMAALPAIAAGHIRTNDPDLARVLIEGAATSPTLAARVARLEASNLVVYLEYEHFPTSGIAGYLTFLGSGGGWRYARIRIRHDLPKRYLVAMLGHELQHAAEIADAPSVVDARAMAALYRRIGHERSRGCQSFETDAAIETANSVLRDLDTGPRSRMRQPTSGHNLSSEPDANAVESR